MKKIVWSLFTISFILNFVWEVLQMAFYAKTGLGESGSFWSFLMIHLSVSLLDALLILGIFLLTEPLARKVNWLLFLILLPLVQALIEYISVYSLNLWEYAPAMPLVFGIGLTPLLQMLILPPLAVILTNKINQGS